MDAEYVKQYNCTLLSGYVFTNVKPESVTKHFFESDVDAIIDPALKQLNKHTKLSSFGPVIISRKMSPYSREILKRITRLNRVKLLYVEMTFWINRIYVKYAKTFLSLMTRTFPVQY